MPPGTGTDTTGRIRPPGNASHSRGRAVAGSSGTLPMTHIFPVRRARSRLARSDQARPPAARQPGLPLTGAGRVARAPGTPRCTRPGSVCGQVRRHHRPITQRRAFDRTDQAGLNEMSGQGRIAVSGLRLIDKALTIMSLMTAVRPVNGGGGTGLLPAIMRRARNECGSSVSPPHLHPRPQKLRRTAGPRGRRRSTASRKRRTRRHQRRGSGACSLPLCTPLLAPRPRPGPYRRRAAARQHGSRPGQHARAADRHRRSGRPS
jgi:hypothetical protein